MQLFYEERLTYKKGCPWFVDFIYNLKCHVRMCVWDCVYMYKAPVKIKYY